MSKTFHTMSERDAERLIKDVVDIPQMLVHDGAEAMEMFRPQLNEWYHEVILFGSKGKDAHRFEHMKKGAFAKDSKRHQETSKDAESHKGKHSKSMKR